MRHGACHVLECFCLVPQALVVRYEPILSLGDVCFVHRSTVKSWLVCTATQDCTAMFVMLCVGFVRFRRMSTTHQPEFLGAL